MTIEDIMADLDPGWLEWRSDLEVGVDDGSDSSRSLWAVSKAHSGSDRRSAAPCPWIDDGSGDGCAAEDEAVGL